MGSYKVSDGDVIRIRFTLTDGDLALTDNLDSMIKRMAVYNENKSVCDAKGYSVRLTALTQLICFFRRLIIRGFRSGFSDHFWKDLRILQHRTRTEHIFIKGLSIMVCHENRAL